MQLRRRPRAASAQLGDLRRRACARAVGALPRRRPPSPDEPTAWPGRRRPRRGSSPSSSSGCAWRCVGRWRRPMAPSRARGGAGPRHRRGQESRAGASAARSSSRPTRPSTPTGRGRCCATTSCRRCWPRGRVGPTATSLDTPWRYAALVVGPARRRAARPGRPLAARSPTVGPPEGVGLGVDRGAGADRGTRAEELGAEARGGRPAPWPSSSRSRRGRGASRRPRP